MISGVDISFFHDLIKSHENLTREWRETGGVRITYRLGLTTVPSLSCLT